MMFRTLLAVCLVFAGAAVRAEQAADAHIAATVAKIAECVAKLKAADPDAVPMAFWDFDGTIIKGDIGDGFTEPDGRGYHGLMEETILAGLVPVYQGVAGFHKWRDEDYPRFCEIGHWLSQAFDAQMYAGVSAERLDAFCERTIREKGLAKWYFASSMAIWRALEKLGVENYVVSANVEAVVRNAAPSLGIPRVRVRGARTETVGGLITTRLIYPIPCGEGKVEAVRELVLSRPQGVAVAGFGNSYGTDGPFLRYVAAQPLPGGARPLSTMINGGPVPEAYKGLFNLVRQETVSR